jgi:hypothetical protein
VLKKLHKRVARKHFATNITVKKKLDSGYWWPTLFQDIHEFYRICDSCQRTRGLKTKSLANFVTTIPKEPFMRWSLDFIGPKKPT